MTGVRRFNELPDAEAKALLESCLAVSRWVEDVLAGRPYSARSSVIERARWSGGGLTASEVDAALTRHPRIGEGAADGPDAVLSRREQAGVDPADPTVADALALGNRDYEARFHRVFLIRAAGRSADEILGELRRRLRNSPEAELREVVGQLVEIAVLRLELLLDAADRRPAVAT